LPGDHLSSAGTEARIADQSRPDTETSSEAATQYEPLDVPPLLPFWLALLLAAFIGGVLLTIELGYPLALHQESPGPLGPLPTTPRLQAAPTRDLQRYEAAKQAELAGRDGTLLSIDAAMRLTVQQGWGPPK
jgi:hypothetical protein